MDISLLLPAMSAGASLLAPKVGEIVATEIVKEATKDAYKKLKSTLSSVCGRRVERAAEKLENDPSSEEAKNELASTIANIPVDDQSDVLEKLQVLISALQEDKAAARVAEVVASIKLDIDSGGHVALATISGARTIDVKSKSVGNFEMRDIEMDRSKATGN